jgi:hypothetical protein
MKQTKIKNTTIEVEYIKNIKCDWCQKNILKNSQFENYCSSLVFMKFVRDDEDGHFIEKESSDFCQDCYVLIKNFLLKHKAKIPSMYIDLDNSEQLNNDTTERTKNV